jgi:S-methylmethionine-dependent homocysteine/selenocysteine methylase
VKSRRWTAYGRIEALLGEGACVVLDGGVGSEVARGDDGPARTIGQPVDTWAIYDQTETVLDVHRRYVSAGCDVISTHTWGILGGIESDRGRRPGRTGLPAWTVATRDAVTLARRAVAEVGRTGQCAVAFCLNDADPLLAGAQVLLGLLWSVDPPDLVLVETLTSVPDRALLSAIAEVAASGLPVWVSFRLSAGPSGQAPGLFSRALGELEGAGVRAVLANCISVQETPDTLAELVATTALPVGCYPRLDEDVDPAEYGELSREWQAAGARIIGGCCGVGPAHIHAVRDRLAPGIPARS